MALYQKYRPQLFADLVGQDHVSRTLLEAIRQNRLTHAYLFAGPRGTGKTTTARLLAKAINCRGNDDSDEAASVTNGEPCNQCSSCDEIVKGRALDVLEIDAASHTGVDDVRELIENARFAPAKLRKKVYIIDEVHMLSKSAFNALLKTLEEPPPHVVFILATTEAHKLPETIISRTQRYDFRRVSISDIVTKLEKIAQSEGITIEEEALNMIARAAEGGHRDAEGLLEQVSSYARDIKVKDVQEVLGIAEQSGVLDLVWAIFNNSAEEGLKIAHRFFDNGTDIATVHRNAIEVIRKVLLYSATSHHFIADTEENIKWIEKAGSVVSQERLVAILRHFLGNLKLHNEVSNPLLPLEISIIESTHQQPVGKHSPTVAQTASAVTKPDSSREKTGKSTTITSKETPTTYLSEKTSKSVSQGGEANKSEPFLTKDAGDQISHIWSQVLAITKQNNSTLAALLRDTKPLSINNNEILLGVRFQFHKDKISDSKNRAVLENTIKQIMGKEFTITCELADIRAAKEGSASDDELQQAVNDVFEVL
ncbi:MAG: DNA polymerase III subunit tau [bacterium ADurb.Bin400]|nr:MAG: DNA polymerase III subunit tau [bacterium ADurb.Bin400]